MSNYSKSDINFILYNNRSVNGTVKNFLSEFNFNGEYIIALDDMLSKYKRKWKKWKTTIIETTKLNLKSNDITITSADIKKLTPNILKSHNELLNNSKYKFELNWILNRGFTTDIIKKWQLGSLQYLLDTCSKRELEILGITTHPLLTNLLNTDISGGGIVIPYFKNNKLLNCTIRRISDTGKLKYTQAIPDISIYGLNKCKNYDTIYITEGIFDAIALHEQEKCAVSASSAVWSSLELYQLLETDVKNIIIFSDNDKVGLSSAAILYDLLSFFDINVSVITSDKCKDACEHFLTNNYTFDDISEIKITDELINSKDEVKFNLVEYLQNRKF
jgi:DNA-dependent RNA polymerase auxiliary subunit epsilon